MKGVTLSIGAYIYSLVLIWTFFSAANVQAKGGVEIGEKCTTNTECSTLHPNSECSMTGICKCKDNYLEVDKKCAAPFQGDCKKDELCINVTTECIKIDFKTYTCLCKTGYETVKGICVGHLGFQCAKDEECPGHLSYCSNTGKCECQDGLRAILDEDKCVSDYNNFCIISGGGCFTPNAECKVVDTSMRCLCPEKYEYSQEKGECISAGTIATCSAITLSLICILIILSA